MLVIIAQESDMGLLHNLFSQYTHLISADQAVHWVGHITEWEEIWVEIEIAGDKYINEIWLLVYELVGQAMGA